MYPIYYTIVILVSVIALISTIAIAREMTKQEKEPTSKDEVERMKNESTNSIPLLSTIYSITFIITVILVWVFIF